MMGRRKDTKRQSRLAFAPIEDPPSPDEPAASPSSFTPSRLRYTNPFAGNVTVKGQLQLEDYTGRWNNVGNSRSDDSIKVNGASRRPASEALPNQKPIKKSTRLRSRLSTSPAPQPTTNADREDSSSSELEIVRPSKRRRVQLVTSSDSESDQNLLPSSPSQSDGGQDKSKMARQSSKPTPRRRSERINVGSSPGGSSPRSKSLKIDMSALAEPEDSASEELASSPTYRNRKGRSNQAPVVVDDTEDSDVVIIPSTKRKKLGAVESKEQGRAPANPVTDDNGSSDDEIVAFTPSRRNSRKLPRVSGSDDSEEGPRTPKRPHSGQDELDLEEDLEDLRDTDLREKRTRGAAVNSARSTRQKHLEMLRRRRAGEKPASNTSKASDAEEYDYEKESHKNAVNAILNWVGLSSMRNNGNDDDDEDGDNSAMPVDEDLDTDDSSFIEQDGEIGAPSVAVPFEFSRHRSKSTKDCFRDVVEWMVHSKLNPAFPRNDEMYTFAFKKVNDEVIGRVGSQLVSTVWGADFQNALRARPYLDVQPHPTAMFDSCQACNRSGHPASSDLKFSGRPYSDETLEPLYDSDSDSSDSDDASETIASGPRRDRDREGRLLPPEERHFYLGRTCKANAVLTHTLIHWRFHLYEWVIDYLNREEELLSSPQRSLDREKLSSKKRTRYANKVVDRMDTKGEVQRLWKDFHSNIRNVRELKDVDVDATIHGHY